MSSVNKAIIIGRVGQDPDIRYLPNGDAVANLSIATSEKYKDKQGQPQEATEWHRVSFFGKTAEVCAKYVKKGSLIFVEGSIKTRKWQDKEGVDHYTTEIRGDRMQMLGGLPAKDESTKEDYAKASAKPSPRGGGASGFDDLTDDIPF